jgi:hypothetical protein
MLMIGLVSGVIAILVGAWRQMCTVLEVRAPFELPSAWRSVLVRIITWAASTGFSVFFRFCSDRLDHCKRAAFRAILVRSTLGAPLVCFKPFRWHCFNEKY